MSAAPNRPSLVPETWTPSFALLVRERFGHDVPERRMPQFRRAVLEACLACGESSLERYLARLAAEALDSPAVMELMARFTIKESYFFRDESMVAALREHVLPELLARKSDSEPLSIWSAGCSLGEEPYTLSILTREAMADSRELRVSIVASDVDELGLQRARVGEFSEWSLRTLNDELRERYFERKGSRFLLRSRYRSGVRFEHHNLVDCADQPPSPGKFDLILCRNVAIYFTDEGVHALYSKLARALKSDGLLLVAPSDPRPPAGVDLETLVMRRGRRIMLGYVQAGEARSSRPQAIDRADRSNLSTLPPPPESSPDPCLQVEESESSVLPAEVVPAAAEKPAWDERLDAETHFSASLVELERNDYAAAEVALKRTLYLCPEHAEAHYRLGLLCARRAEFVTARRCFFNALGIVRKRGASGLAMAALIGAQLAKLDKG
ncbi:MAG TPA: protein-glutamate O-methyltransferase CheR [Polyangiaceae bacterium]|nr:protein-glutamate O-methyltransferase CheR [Polyangiaceae bacterium]